MGHLYSTVTSRDSHYAISVRSGPKPCSTAKTKNSGCILGDHFPPLYNDSSLWFVLNLDGHVCGDDEILSIDLNTPTLVRRIGLLL